MKCMKNICQKMQVVSIYSSSSTVTIWNGDIKDHGRVARKVVDVTCGGVDEENFAIRPHSITFMNMTVHMIFGFDPLLHAMKKIHTPCSHSTDRQVSESKRRTVSDEDVSVVRNQVPLVKTLLTSL